MLPFRTQILQLQNQPTHYAQRGFVVFIWTIVLSFRTFGKRESEELLLNKGHIPS